MGKKLFTFIFALFGLCANAAICGDDYELIILLNDSSTVTCDFTKAPQMTFENNQIVLDQISGEAQRWEFDEVLSWSFGVVSGIEDAKSVDGNTISISDNIIQANGTAYANLIVCDVQGQVLRKVVAGTDGKVSLNLTELPSAIYLIKFGKNSLKFIKR